MTRLGMIEKFQKFLFGSSPKEQLKVPQEVMQEIDKSLRNKSGYKDTGKEKIYSVDLNAPDGKILVLEDGSQWSPAGKLGLDQNHALHWSPGETVSFRTSGGNMYVLTNLDMEETSRWIFQGYVENWGTA